MNMLDSAFALPGNHACWLANNIAHRLLCKCNQFNLNAKIKASTQGDKMTGESTVATSIF